MIAALATISAAPAQAQPGAPSPAALASARGIAAQAMRFYDAGQYGRAIELFEKADAEYPSPTYRVYAARAYVRWGKLRRAVARYTEAVQMSPPTGAATFVEAQKTAADERAELVQRLAVLRIEVTGAPPEAVTLTVDGERIPAGDWAAVRLDSGPHQIEAVAEATSASRGVSLVERASERVTLELKPPVFGRFTVPIVTAFAVGGAGLVVAIVTGGVLGAKHAAINASCSNKACTPTGTALIKSLPPLDDANSAGWGIGLIGLSLGGLGAVLATIDRNRTKRATALLPAALPGGGGLWVTGRF
jgi:tetratricopeptide (TPR) repeat protein